MMQKKKDSVKLQHFFWFHQFCQILPFSAMSEDDWEAKANEDSAEEEDDWEKAEAPPMPVPAKPSVQPIQVFLRTPPFLLYTRTSASSVTPP